jgi:hypothetical protein
MSYCPQQYSTCQIENKYNTKILKSTTSQINACQSGSFPTLVEEIDDQDESTHKKMGETDEEAWDICLAFDNDLDVDVNNIEIKEDDCIFMVIVHPVDPHHFIYTGSIVSGHLVEASAKNSQPKEFHEIVPIALHTYADVFSETAFNMLPQHQKWDHAIELEHEPSPGFRKVYPITLTEKKEVDSFLEDAL